MQKKFIEVLSAKKVYRGPEAKKSLEVLSTEGIIPERGPFKIVLQKIFEINRVVVDAYRGPGGEIN